TAAAPRSNSWTTVGMSLSAHSTWARVPVSVVLPTFLEMPRVSRDSYTENTRELSGCNIRDLKAVALLRSHIFRKLLQCRVKRRLPVESVGRGLDRAGQKEIGPSRLAEL